MKAKSTLALVAVAGCACTVASAQMSMNKKAVEVAPKWQPVMSAPMTATISKDAPKIIPTSIQIRLFMMKKPNHHERS